MKFPPYLWQHIKCTLDPRIQTQLRKSLLRMMSWVRIFGYKIHLICSHDWGENFIHYFMIMHSFTMRIVKYISSQEMSNGETIWTTSTFGKFETKRNLMQNNWTTSIPLLAIWNKEEFDAKEENWYIRNERMDLIMDLAIIISEHNRYIPTILGWGEI